MKSFLYALELDVTPGAKKLELPEDDHITVFAITASENRMADVTWGCEPRALPVIE